MPVVVASHDEDLHVGILRLQLANGVVHIKVRHLDVQQQDICRWISTQHREHLVAIIGFPNHSNPPGLAPVSA